MKTQLGKVGAPILEAREQLVGVFLLLQLTLFEDWNKPFPLEKHNILWWNILLWNGIGLTCAWCIDTHSEDRMVCVVTVGNEQQPWQVSENC